MGCSRWAHRVILVGIDHHIVVLARCVQSAAHLHRVLEMDIVVCRAVDDKQLFIETYQKRYKELKKELKAEIEAEE